MKNIEGHTIDPNFNTLAGPYNMALPQEVQWLNNVINDMKRGNIEYMVVRNGDFCDIQRKGMIVTIR